MLPTALLRPVGVFAASRVVVFVALWMATRIKPELTLSQVLSAWDGGWYLEAVRSGYPDAVPDGASTLAFFPLYPFLVRVVIEVTGLPALGAALAVNLVAGTAAAVLLWLLGRELLGAPAADRAVALFAFFPGSFVLSMVYAEGVMLVAAAGCLWALVRRRWLLAGVLAALATASRPNGIAVIGACAWAALVALRDERAWRSLTAPVLAPAGILGFFALLWSRTGVPTAWFEAQKAGWEERVVPLGLIADLQQFARNPFLDVNNTVVVLGAIVAIAGLVLLLRSDVPGEVVVFTLIVLGLAFVSETLGPRPRFVLTAFPLFLGAGAHLRGVALSAVVGASSCILGAFTVLTVTTLLATP